MLFAGNTWQPETIGGPEARQETGEEVVIRRRSWMKKQSETL